MLPINFGVEEPHDMGLRSKYVSNDQPVKPPIVDKEPFKIKKNLKIDPDLSLG